jgi:wyosine [tRNA(Phe)-imidazoG37] synthetase (radical SAM superfamily)
MQVCRSKFYPLEKVIDDVKSQIWKAEARGERIDFITFVPDGEPTLDINLGEEIKTLKSLGKKIAVIQNSSLLWRQEVRNNLMGADWVSLKVDTVSDNIWRRLNRPHKELDLEVILRGVKTFAREFRGELATETMMIRDYNNYLKEVKKIANFLEEVNPDKAYISIPTRPPAEEFVRAAGETSINQAYQVFSKTLEEVEYLIGYEGDAFAYTGDIEEDLLSITSVHPMREEGVKNLLLKANSDWSLVDRLIKEKKLLELDYMNKKILHEKDSEPFT